MIEQSQQLRIQLNTVITSCIQSIPILSSIPEQQRISILQVSNRNDVSRFCEQSHDTRSLPLPPQVRSILDTVLTTHAQRPDHRSSLIARLVQFLQMKIPYTVEDLTGNKAKAIYGLIPSCEELVQTIANQKRKVEQATSLPDAITALENVVNTIKEGEGEGEEEGKGKGKGERREKGKSDENEEDDEVDDFSERLGVADSITSLDHFKRRGVQLSPWVWYGSLTTHPERANVEYYPDLIVEGMTVRWDCPVCHEVMYVTKEELISHLNKCVHFLVCLYK